MKGYKATDKNLRCLNFQFELNKWYEHVGLLQECKAGFHFCEQPSGPWAYYSDPGTRIFEVEAEEVLDTPFIPGSDYKRVCRRIKLVKEITPRSDRNTGSGNTGYGNTGNSNAGYYNTGYGNTGNWNSGNSNAGNRNSGNWNSGYFNAGNSNAGDKNTGYGNTGNSNAGNSNAGNFNTGHRNTGHRNTGYFNAGDSNAGDCNTGSGNATNYSSGFFCVKEPHVISFDVQTKLTRGAFAKKYPEYSQLCEALMKNDPIDVKLYARIPGITKAKLKKLHNRFKIARNKPTPPNREE